MTDYSWQTVAFAFLLTLFAGLSTGVGSALAFFTKKMDERFLSAALGFSAGIMIYVSFVEILVKARDALDNFFGASLGNLYTTLGFFGGIALIAIIDAFVPKSSNPHEVRSVEEMDEGAQQNEELMRMGLFSALAIAIHNFPEGLATFIAALEDPSMGVSIAIAIAIHNIPEGIAVSVPIYYATKSRRQAFKYSFMSGLSEPLGALIGFLLLMPFLNEAVLGIVFAIVAGIMVYISLDELLPSAQKYGEHHVAIGGLIAGMAVMATSLVLLG
ncbi:zinc transporter ZupT [Jeotgalibaca caeni]|uniref:zinc transporter ZupT n=1 Tax=Jeotgalibaca caeni TaxID=3028623 RepID=UPI00237EABA0|nr:zinc transporter ZupT [Jeotgalibaca caeni]MDE1549153.1 zinc transporter ZupT [Jeotgalibaca caeni]